MCVYMCMCTLMNTCMRAFDSGSSCMCSITSIHHGHFSLSISMCMHGAHVFTNMHNAQLVVYILCVCVYASVCTCMHLYVCVHVCMSL